MNQVLENEAETQYVSGPQYNHEGATSPSCFSSLGSVKGP